MEYEEVGKMASIIGTIIIGLIIILLGYLIWFKKMLFLIAGFRPDTFYGDESKYAKRMGLLAILMGILTVLLPFSIILFGHSATTIYEVLMITLVIAAIIVGNYWRFRM
jgi:hypothetical protein